MSGNSAFNRDIKITPSILSADFANFGAEVEAIEQQGCDWVHVDVMDGHFVPNITFGPQTCEAIRPHVKTVMDVHFMIAPVDPFIEAFTEAGSDILTAHVEAGPHLDRTLQAIRAAGCKACQALNPATPAESIAHVLDRIDLVCVMTVNPGFGGQSFIQSIVPKVESLREMIGDRQSISKSTAVSQPRRPLSSPRPGLTSWLPARRNFKGGCVGRPEVHGGNITAIRKAAETARAGVKPAA